MSPPAGCSCSRVGGKKLKRLHLFPVKAPDGSESKTEQKYLLSNLRMFRETMMMQPHTIILIPAARNRKQDYFTLLIHYTLTVDSDL